MSKHMSQVRLSVPNCESEQLVMWVLCEEINGQKMIDFVVSSRGINFSPSSRGLVGKSICNKQELLLLSFLKRKVDYKMET